MGYRKPALLVILLVLYISVAVHNPPQWFKALGFNQILDVYGRTSARCAPLTWVSNPGLSAEVINQDGPVAALIPDGSSNHQQRVEQALQLSPRAVVECSAIDAWHHTAPGKQTLEFMKGRSYRVVVFDGGHHLPTLGLEPDILLIPVFRNTAAHSYMRDGMEVRTISRLLEELDSPAVAVTVPRWLLVKRPGNLEILTERVIDEAGYRAADEQAAFKPCAAPGMSFYRGTAMAYVNREQLEEPRGYAERIRQLSGSNHIERVYLAFNYSRLDPVRAEQWSQQVSRQLGAPVEVVNRPVKVTDLILGR